MALVCEHADGRLRILAGGREVSYKQFDKHGYLQQAEIVSNKRLGAVLQAVKERQQDGLETKRTRSFPKRRIPAPGLRL